MTYKYLSYMASRNHLRIRKVETAYGTFYILIYRVDKGTTRKRGVCLDGLTVDRLCEIIVELTGEVIE